MTAPEQQRYGEISGRRNALHQWINRRQDERRKNGEPQESTLYEWKDMEAERERLPGWLQRAFEGNLPTIHQQCSRQPPEPIAENHLICALGQDVTTCPMLLSLRETFDEQRVDERRWHEKNPRFTLDLTDESVYQAMATVCTWHIYTSVFQVPPKRESRLIDTSEGYVQDESDRRFWRNTYDSLQAGIGDEDDEGDPDVTPWPSYDEQGRLP